MPGTLQDVYVGDIFDAPLASQRGVFGTFNTNTGDGGIEWVALPAWTQLLQVCVTCSPMGTNSCSPMSTEY